MTEENKKLLLKDICARLPYGVMIQHPELFCQSKMVVEKLTGVDNEHINDDGLPIEVVKPHLRPMSSMTEDEMEELKSKCTHTETEEDWEGVRCDVWGIQILDKYDTRRWGNPIYPSAIDIDAIDWLNAHHFDYRGLIGKGLALEAPNEMYNTKSNKYGKSIN